MSKNPDVPETTDINALVQEVLREIDQLVQFIKSTPSEAWETIATEVNAWAKKILTMASPLRSVAGGVDPENQRQELHDEFLERKNADNLDQVMDRIIAEKVAPALRRGGRLIIVADVDSNMYNGEGLDDLVELAQRDLPFEGLPELVEVVTDLGMENHIDFRKSLATRLNDLGLVTEASVHQLDNHMANNPVNPHLRRSFERVNQFERGHTILVSRGFKGPITRWARTTGLRIKPLPGLNPVYANDLVKNPQDEYYVFNPENVLSTGAGKKETRRIIESQLGPNDVVIYTGDSGSDFSTQRPDGPQVVNIASLYYAPRKSAAAKADLVVVTPADMDRFIERCVAAAQN